MSGKRYLLYTNAVVALFQGNTQLMRRLQSAEWIGISIITQIEFLAFSGLNGKDKQLFNRFLQRVDVIGLDSEQRELIDLVIGLRQQYGVKLPDAIIAATAIKCEANLITADRQFQKVQELDVVNFA